MLLSHWKKNMSSKIEFEISGCLTTLFYFVFNFIRNQDPNFNIVIVIQVA